MKEQKNIYLMYTLAFLQGMVFYGPVSTLYRQAQGLSVFQITLIESISLLLSLALEIPWRSRGRSHSTFYHHLAFFPITSDPISQDGLQTILAQLFSITLFFYLLQGFLTAFFQDST